MIRSLAGFEHCFSLVVDRRDSQILQPYLYFRAVSYPLLKQYKLLILLLNRYKQNWKRDLAHRCLKAGHCKAIYSAKRYMLQCLGNFINSESIILRYVTISGVRLRFFPLGFSYDKPKQIRKTKCHLFTNFREQAILKHFKNGHLYASNYLKNPNHVHPCLVTQYQLGQGAGELGLEKR